MAEKKRKANSESWRFVSKKLKVEKFVQVMEIGESFGCRPGVAVWRIPLEKFSEIRDCVLELTRLAPEKTYAKWFKWSQENFGYKAEPAKHIEDIGKEDGESVFGPEGAYLWSSVATFIIIENPWGNEEYKDSEDSDFDPDDKDSEDSDLEPPDFEPNSKEKGVQPSPKFKSVLHPSFKFHP
jgi:hypothetical protein